MAKRNRKPRYLYGLILNQEHYPVIVHKARQDETAMVGATVLEAACGAGVNQSVHDLEDRRNRIEVMHRLLDGNATVFCARCYPKRKDDR